MDGQRPTCSAVRQLEYSLIRTVKEIIWQIHPGPLCLPGLSWTPPLTPTYSPRVLEVSFQLVQNPTLLEKWDGSGAPSREATERAGMGRWTVPPSQTCKLRLQAPVHSLLG